MAISLRDTQGLRAMDAHDIAAEKKAQAAALLKEAEEIEKAAKEIERLAAKFNWHVDIKPANISAATVTYGTVKSVAVMDPNEGRRRGGKAPDPNSTTFRSKRESVRIVRELKRPVPLGEMLTRLGQIGIKLGGRNPNQALSANLCQTPELVSTKRGWWLVGEPLPPEDKSPVIGRNMDLPGLS